MTMGAILRFGVVAGGAAFFAGAPAPDCAAAGARRATRKQSVATTAPAGMVFIPGGTFTMGANSGLEFEGPPHRVTVRPFFMDRTEVTVARFAEFVAATGHETEAERRGVAKAFVVKSGKWEDVEGADWRHPEGPDAPASRPEEPVVQVSWDDAVAFAKWAGRRLPTEAEWEFAARGGLEGATYAWGNELAPGGKPMGNWWQGDFPRNNKARDGFVLRAPVGSFPPNGYGLHDMAGNVWEWVADWYEPDYFSHSPMLDPQGPTTGTLRAVRGGSFLCNEGFCRGYRAAARNRKNPDTGISHLGFRCVLDAPGQRPAKRGTTG